jgi:hypothetical protein
MLHQPGSAPKVRSDEDMHSFGAGASISFSEMNASTTIVLFYIGIIFWHGDC